MEPLLEIGIEPARLPAKLGYSKPVLQHHVHLRLARRQRQDTVSEGLVVIEVTHRFLWPPYEVVATRHTFDADSGRSELDETAEARAVTDQDFGRKPAAKRLADEVYTVEPHFLTQVEIEQREVRHRMDLRRSVGPAESGL